MENAAKALIIAGGILLAIMTLTLLVYGITSTARIEQARAEGEKTEELANFNMEYEAYNKKRMYGVDVITAVNKAINHNKAMKAANIGDPYYINIKLITKEEFKSELHIITYDKNTGNTNEEYTQDASYLDSSWVDMKNLLNKKIEEGPHELSEIENKFEGSLNDITKIEDNSNTKKTYTVYSALTDLKKAIFECKETHYDPQTGRIDSMTFEQIKPNNEIY